MLAIINTWLTYPETEPEMEINSGKLETQPDEVLSIKDMLLNHTRGIYENVQGQGEYYPEEYGYIPDPKQLDLVERQELSDRYHQFAKRFEEEETLRRQQLENPTPAPSGQKVEDIPTPPPEAKP